MTHALSGRYSTHSKHVCSLLRHLDRASCDAGVACVSSRGDCRDPVAAATCTAAIRTHACHSRRSVAGVLIGLVSLLSTTHITNSIADEPAVKVTDESFKCITEMTPVRHFYVDNLQGSLPPRSRSRQRDRVTIRRARGAADAQRGHDQTAEGLQYRYARLGVLLHRRIEGRIEDTNVDSRTSTTGSA